jgi:hypothetical protein
MMATTTMKWISCVKNKRPLVSVLSHLGRLATPHPYTSFQNRPSSCYRYARHTPWPPSHRILHTSHVDARTARTGYLLVRFGIGIGGLWLCWPPQIHQLIFEHSYYIHRPRS